MSEQDGGPAADITLLTSCRELIRLNELLKAYRELVKRLDRPEPLPTCEALRIGLTAPPREIVMEEIARDIANAQAKVAELEAGR